MKYQRDEAVENFKEKILSQKKKLILGGVIFIALVFTVLGLYVYNIKQKNDARELETEAYRYYFNLVRNSNLSQEQRFIKAAELFYEAYKKNKNVTYLLNAGYAYDMAGQTDKAIETLATVENSGDINFSNMAKIRAAMIYLKSNQRSQAVKKLNEVIEGKSVVLKDFALYELGNISLSENKEEAHKYFDRLVRDFPQSPFSEMARKILESNK